MSRFRVLQFNMQFGQGWDAAAPDRGLVNLGSTVAEIQSHAADIIILQELEQAQAHGSQVIPPPNYSRLCAELPEYHGCFAYPKPDPRELPFGIGLAILSRHPVRNFTRVDLPSPAIEFEFQGRRTTPTDRVLISATTIAAGREVRVLNTHLLAFFMLGATSEQHPEQRCLVAQQLAAAKGATILGGDFNVRRHETLMAQFADCGFKTVQDREITWRRQPYVLDHVFYNAPLRCVAHQVVPTLASDHHAIVADFEFVP